MPDAFDINLLGARSLIEDDVNKLKNSDLLEEGVNGDYEDNLELPMSDEELITLSEEWEASWNAYAPKVQARQKRNKTYLKGIQRSFSQDNRVVPKNILFEATATFVPASLAKNPEPVVFSDNTDEGKDASNDLKTMLQYHAIHLGMRQKLGVMVWQWSEYFIGALKHGWEPMEDPQTGKGLGDITTELRKPQNLILDPEGYVDEFGDFKGWLGDRIDKPASWWVDMYPSHETFFTLKANGKMGTVLVGTEWWSADNLYTFTKMQDQILDKHKNEFFNYEEGKPNHFATPKKPYTFLSVFSLQEEPFDFTNLIEQNIANQDRINDRDADISKNLASGVNAIALSGQSFTTETADQAVQTFYQDGFLLIPDGNMDAVKRIPASPLPNGIMEAQASDMQALRSVYGTSGLVPNQNPDEAVRNNIMNEQHDSSRIGGGVGDRLEITAANVFNWWTQLYCVFYDEEHYGAVMGNASAVEYTAITSQNMERKFVVTVSPNSMKPKDETAQMNQALELWSQKGIDPINLMKALDDPDPVNSAKMLVMWTTNPALYLQTFFPETAQQMAPAASGGMPGTPEAPGAPAGGAPETVAPQPSSSPLAAVPLTNNSMPT